VSGWHPAWCFVSWLHCRHPNLLYSHLNTNVSHAKVTKIRCAKLATRHLWIRHTVGLRGCLCRYVSSCLVHKSHPCKLAFICLSLLSAMPTSQNPINNQCREPIGIIKHTYTHTTVNKSKSFTKHFERLERKWVGWK